MTDTSQSGRVDFSREGFSVFWDARGLRIQAVEYHAETLELSWEMILELAQRARLGPSLKPTPPDVAGR